jgi:hypothetical protein
MQARKKLSQADGQKVCDIINQLLVSDRLWRKAALDDTDHAILHSGRFRSALDQLKDFGIDYTSWLDDHIEVQVSG